VKSAFKFHYLCRHPCGEDPNFGEFESSIKSVDFVSPGVKALE
jgi:hypothetical protein